VSITVHLPNLLARLAEDQPSIEAKGATVGDAIDDIIERFPALGPRLRDEEGKQYPFVTLYLNDEDIRFQGGFGAAASDGDELIIVPTVAGG